MTNPKIVSYSADALQFISTKGVAIIQVAQILNVSAGAIAGGIAEENHAYLASSWDKTLDKYVLGAKILQTDASIRDNYSFMRSVPGIDAGPSSGWLGKASEYSTRLLNPILIDVGPTNLKFYSAIRLLEKYFSEHSTSDPLALSAYKNDYRLFLEDLASANVQDNTAIKIWGLAIKEAIAWFLDPKKGAVDIGWWNNQGVVTQDALAITFVNFGQEQMSEKRQTQYINIGKLSLLSG